MKARGQQSLENERIVHISTQLSTLNTSDCRLEDSKVHTPIFIARGHRGSIRGLQV
jgi:hypothetical protein